MLLLFLPLIAAAQQSIEKSMRFGRLDMSDGLSQGMVFCVFQDSRGFMWFGTKEGLNRYDGHTFLVYKKKPGDATSLPDNYVLAITEDVKGRLWLGTNAGGLVMFDPARERFTPVPLSKGTDGAMIQGVDDIEMDDMGKLWVSVYGMQLFSLDVSLPDPAAIASSRRFNGPSLTNRNLEVNRLRTDALGRLCFLNQDGLYIYNGGREKWNLVVSQTLHYANNQGSFQFNFSATQSDSTIWVAAGVQGVSQLLHVSPDGKRVLDSMRIHLDGKDQYIRDMLQGPDGNMYMVSYEWFIQYDSRSGTLSAAPADKYKVAGYTGWGNHLFISRGGILWISTSGYGLHTFNPMTLSFNARPGSLTEALFGKEIEAFDRSIRQRTGGAMRLLNEVYPLRVADGSVWCGTRDHGLLHYEAHTGQVTHYGVNKVDPFSFLMLRLNRPFVDSKRRVWVGNRHGISRLVDTPEQWEHYWFDPDGPDLTAIDDRVTCWQEGKDGSLWMGTMAHGLAHFRVETGEFEFFTYDSNDSTSISHDHVLTIAPDPAAPDRYLWVGTDGGGLNRFDFQKRSFVRMATTAGILSPVVYGILPDAAGMLWMSTNDGLYRFDPRYGQSQHYDLRDGLQANEFNRGEYYRIGNLLCFGGVDGYNIFDQAEIRDNDAIPDVALTSFRLFNRDIKPGAPDSPLEAAIPYTRSITLAHDQNMFTIEFAALDYHAPNRNQYRYRLEGFTDGWIDAGTERSATFTNLDPGEYVFQVVGSNNHGVWNSEGVRLRIVITPPWWYTGWAFGLYAIIIFSSLFAVDRIQRRRVITRERERSEYREAQLRAEAAESEARAVRAENERTQKEMQVASVIQQRVLPQRLPRIPCYELAGINLPAEEIGGDYYDCISLQDGRTAFVMADVTGKGVPASLLVNSLHAALHVHLHHEVELKELVHQLNAFLYESSPPSAFITFLIVLLEPETGAIELINAGHNPALLHHDGNVIDTQRNRNLPLGCSTTMPPYENEFYELKEGDGLLLYTDGITEAMNVDLDPFGQDALEALILEYSKLPASMLVGTIIAELRQYTSGTEQSDDITALYIRRKRTVETADTNDSDTPASEDRAHNPAAQGPFTPGLPETERHTFNGKSADLLRSPD
ncbi:MAG: SpoIIE family protein phosphatase [Bacteroidetes bacterium]|nr:SpoIIE family protein phosphatase [Bacteroidota bacterium]